MKRVAVVMGGPSEEHAVSLASGQAVVAGLKQAGLDVLPVWIKRDTSVVFGLPSEEAGPPMDLWTGMARLDVDCVFIAMHGPFGEDGVFQALLEAANLPFTGSDHVGAAIAMDKILSKPVYESVGLGVPPYHVIKSSECLANPAAMAKKIMDLGFPMVLKTPRLGSSVGIALVKDMAGLTEYLERLAKMDRHVLAEGFIEGREFTVPVLEDAGHAMALPVIEIRVHSGGVFDYETKYNPNMVDEVCPAPIQNDLAKRLSRAGILAHEALMLSGFSRSDFIVDKAGKIFILETNAIPGLTPISLFPRAARVAGMTFPELLMKICQSAVSR